MQLNADGSSSIAAKKKTVNQAAEDLEAYATRLKVEVPLYAETMSKAMNAYAKSATLLPYFNPENYDQLEESANGLETMYSVLKSAIENTTAFRQSISSVPPATTQYNRAKRHTLAVLDDFLAQMDRTKNLIPQVQNTMREIIAGSKKEKVSGEI